MQLRDLQLELQRDLLGQESAIAGAIVDAPPLPIESRLGIYRHAYRARLIEALGEVYPALHRLLGDEVFQSAGAAFVETHPSEHRSVRWYGGELAEFLAGSEPFAGQPWLSELARFEWLLAEVFDSEDAVAIDRTALATVDPERWAALRFAFHPSVRRLRLSWNTVALWQALSNEEEPPAPAPTPTPVHSAEPVHWLVWRQDLRNYFRSLDAPEVAALDAASRGATFTGICETLTALLPEEEVPLRAATLMATWTDSGILSGLEQAS